MTNHIMRSVLTQPGPQGDLRHLLKHLDIVRRALCGARDFFRRIWMQWIRRRLDTPVNGC